MPEILGDVSEHCIPFILERLKGKQYARQLSPLFVGINGAQGSGKSTLAETLADKLSQPPNSLPIIVFSIDDLYLTHDAQAELAAAHPDNPLVQHRGQPSTHDLPLALSLFSDLSDGKKTRIPAYDKSAYSGQGDRVAKESWAMVNQEGKAKTEIVIFEGWCVGFRPLAAEELRRKWQDAIQQRERGEYQGRLGWNKFEDIEFINKALSEYDSLTDQLDALIHLDAKDPQFVFVWRLEQEAHLRKMKGSGMTDEQVVDFVNGYYPAYELFTDSLRKGTFGEEQGRQLRLILEKDRKVEEVVRV